MKTVVIIILVALASSSYASQDSVKWTSDTTYVRGGKEYWDSGESYLKSWYRSLANDPQPELDYNYFFIHDLPRMKRPDLDDQDETMIV